MQNFTIGYSNWKKPRFEKVADGEFTECPFDDSPQEDSFDVEIFGESKCSNVEAIKGKISENISQNFVKKAEVLWDEIVISFQIPVFVKCSKMDYRNTALLLNRNLQA